MPLIWRSRRTEGLAPHDVEVPSGDVASPFLVS
jgi:hypothetical protein